VPRGSSGSSSSGGSTSSTTGSNGGNERAGERGNGRNSGEATGTSRPRDGRRPVGTATERRGPAPSRGGGASYPGVIYDPYYGYAYSPYYGYGGGYSSFWNPYGYGFGLGYFAYDPFLFGGYGYGGGYAPGYGYGPYGPDPGYGYGYGNGSGYGDPSGSYGSSQGGYGSSSSSGYRGVGSIRLKVKPADAQVYVDGYFMGLVNSFDGSFQRLEIEAGPHKVEVRGEGYEPEKFDVMVTAGGTVTYKGELKRTH
jgi:hypothetical protein